MTTPKRSAGTLFRPREQLPWPADEPFRILSIDGGGIKGILPAALLARIEEEITRGVPAGRYFDMIAGTSTGGIIALALGFGLPASTVHKIYVDQGAEIFPRRTGRSPILRGLQLAWRALNDLHRYRHDADALERALSGAFGAAMLGQCERRLVVPAFDWNTEVFLFKTPHHPDYKLDWPNPLVTVARATSAAPTYFRAFKGADRRFLDGGVSANNPNEKNEVLKFLTKVQASGKNVLFASDDKFAMFEAFDKSLDGQFPVTLLLSPGGDVLYKHSGPIDAMALKREILKAIGREKVK